MSRFSEMTARERWKAVLQHEKPDRLPMSFRATDEFIENLLRYTGFADLDEFQKRYHIDGKYGLSPLYIGPVIPENSNIYGCKYIFMNYKNGRYRECNYHPLAKYQTIEELEQNYTWPDIELYDFSGIAEEAKNNAGELLVCSGWEPFLLYKELRGEEQGYIDLIENPELCRHIMNKLFEFHYEIVRRTLEEANGLILISTCSEDLGSQIGLLYSPAHIRDFFLPLHKKMIKMMHEHGAYVFWHTDGAARYILPDLIALGVDVLDPVQWRCPGMEREELMRDFGKALVFHGGIDNQWTLPFGTTEDVRAEVRKNFEIFGRQGGYVMGPCHNIQPINPVENVIAMYETGYRECRY